MLDILLAILALAFLFIVVVLAISALTGVGLGILLGKMLERVFDVLVPHRRTGVAAEDLLDQIGTVTGPFSSAHEAVPPRGMIRLRGEHWSAEALPGTELPVGHPVRVVAVDGLVLVVEPAQAEGAV